MIYTDHCGNSLQALTPVIFDRLFSRCVGALRFLSRSTQRLVHYVPTSHRTSSDIAQTDSGMPYLPMYTVSDADLFSAPSGSD